MSLYYRLPAYSILGLFLVFNLTSCGTSHTAQGAREGAGAGAAMGAFSALIWGGDVVEGAARGAAVGATAGAISGSGRDAQARADAQQIQQAERRAADAERRAANAENVAAEEQKYVDMFGKDVYEGYKALLQCEHQRAQGLAQAGKAAQVSDHRLAAEWLDALIAVDRRDTERANQVFDRLIDLDADIDSRQQASIATDKVLLEMRQERRDLGLSSCG